MGREEKASTRRSYSDAEAAADLATYRALKRAVSIRTLVVVAVAALAIVAWFPLPALALFTGGVCGALNALLTMRSGERLVENRSVGGFVLRSFVRIGLFGIIPVAFAVRGPWWAMGWYFAGFFLPLVMFAFGARRAFAAK